ncbi:hypothetical protein BZB76_0879 [Actinomadura pelletieri DSM 43383]|uniref:Uncharacterized protein n=1 Tax=Actinomadura pelletieri DSM 43383 TaxID=1120940 RepID=A0A495QZN5_9ACTN|nr:hypothetical protein [Actinomadura pelletieri]RKS79414.1 hypothetical protein BZB76_0879 [Actinomadura pelletieri DSM 43383]
MARSRTNTPLAGVLALVFVGGAVATVIGVIMTVVGLYETTLLVGFRHSTAYYAIQCLIVGVITAAGIMLTRPRGPVAPIFAAVSAYFALYVATRTGLLIYMFYRGSVPTDFIVEALKPRFYGWDLLAPLAAAAVGGLRVLMVAGASTPGPQPFTPPGQPFTPPGQPFAAPGAQPPVPGPPMPPPPYQPPPAPGQGATPGWSQGGPPPNVGG